MDNLLIVQQSPSLVGSLQLGFELKTSGFDTILSCMHQPIQFKSLGSVWFGFQPVVAFTESQKPTKGFGCGRKPPPKVAFPLFKTESWSWGALTACGHRRFEEITHCHWLRRYRFVFSPNSPPGRVGSVQQFFQKPQLSNQTVFGFLIDYTSQ